MTLIPSPNYRITMMLADHVQVAENKLFIMGGGWDMTGPGPAQFGVAIKIEVPWDRTNRRTKLKLSLLTEDGGPVLFPGPNGETPLLLDGDFEVGRPPGVKPGTPITVPVALNFGPLALKPDSRYQFVVEVDGISNDEWNIAFSTRPGPSPAIPMG